MTDLGGVGVRGCFFFQVVVYSLGIGNELNGVGQGPLDGLLNIKMQRCGIRRWRMLFYAGFPPSRE